MHVYVSELVYMYIPFYIYHIRKLDLYIKFLKLDLYINIHKLRNIHIKIDSIYTSKYCSLQISSLYWIFWMHHNDVFLLA
jgi:hypothetical protein